METHFITLYTLLLPMFLPFKNHQNKHNRSIVFIPNTHKTFCTHVPTDGLQFTLIGLSIFSERNFCHVIYVVFTKPVLFTKCCLTLFFPDRHICRKFLREYFCNWEYFLLMDRYFQNTNFSCFLAHVLTFQKP